MVHVLSGRIRLSIASATLEWIEAWYNPHRRHSYCRMLSPVDYEADYRARQPEKTA